MLHVAFLWHMHQPYYRDPFEGNYTLPWVRLHALKGYYDMVSILEEFPDIHQTFNLVPSLLRQILDYTQGNAKDIFLEHSRKPAEDLSSEEKKFILSNFFTCSWETMIKPYPRYWELLNKRGLRDSKMKGEDEIESYSIQDYRDLQVWFNLTWFGYRAREKKDAIKYLFQKAKGFTESDKVDLFRAQQEIIGEIIPMYRSARARGQIEITVSPFYHPILPLLIDWESAKRSMPSVSLPGSFRHPEDAQRQIQKAVTYFENLFGSPPLGMWPPEGSVSPEIIPLVAQSRIRWVATDEGILFKSLPNPMQRNRLFQPYRVAHQGTEISIIFRDRNLSDLIGFTYAKNPPKESAKDLLRHLKNIERALAGERRNHIVLIALDGENPWEYYPDGGREFLGFFYDHLCREPSLPTVSVSEFLAQNPPQEILDHLHTGSWIDQNFRIWIGSPEDNRAWSLLKKTRSLLEAETIQRANHSPEKKEMAWEEIDIAEGSDWFWWFGDDFHSDQKPEFDRLFRSHLRKVYALLDKEIPESLNWPIDWVHPVKTAIEPMGLISPQIDGRITHFYEWKGAGSIETRSPQTSMYRGENFVQGAYYGFDLDHFYFRLDPIGRPSKPLKDLYFIIHFLHPRDLKIVVPLELDPGTPPYFFLETLEGSPAVSPPRFTTIAVGKIIELSIPWSILEFQKKERVEFFISIQRGEIELERHPNRGYLAFTVPDQDFETMVWQV